MARPAGDIPPQPTKSVSQNRPTPRIHYANKGGVRHQSQLTWPRARRPKARMPRMREPAPARSVSSNCT